MVNDQVNEMLTQTETAQRWLSHLGLQATAARQALVAMVSSGADRPGCEPAATHGATVGNGLTGRRPHVMTSSRSTPRSSGIRVPVVRKHRAA